MKRFLRTIIIEAPSGERRSLSFEPGVNIISGTGSKGKSAVLRIVEYCLGSSRCRIPVGKVQDYAAWYCLELTVRDQRVFIGRRAPDPRSPDQSTDGEAYYQQGPHAVLAERLSANTSVGSALRALGRLLGLPQGTFKLGLDDTEVGRLEVPELLPLLLQPQDVIARSGGLFMSGDEDRGSRERSKQVIEIALGIVTDNLLILRAQQELAEARKKTLISEQKKADAADRVDREKLSELWQMAAQAGIVSAEPPGSTNEMHREFARIKKTIPEATTPIVQDGTARARDEAEATELRKALERLREDLERIAMTSVQATGASATLVSELERLRVVDVLSSDVDDESHCPLCDSVVPSKSEEVIAAMRDSLAHELSFVEEVVPKFDDAKVELLKRAREAERKLKVVEGRLNPQPQAIAPSLTVARIEQERVIGAVIHQLKWTPKVGLAAPRIELERIKDQLEELKSTIQGVDFENADSDMRKRLSDRMTEMAEWLKRAELLGGTLAFDQAFSTIERRRDGRRERLDVIGGAENYVMFHVCAMLALHCEFLRLESGVPHLLILDQPSQTYYPSGTDARRVDDKAVRRIYDLIFRVADECRGQLQIIVLDHADYSSEDPRFERAKKYDWHNEGALIPLR